MTKYTINGADYYLASDIDNYLKEVREDQVRWKEASEKRDAIAELQTKEIASLRQRLSRHEG